MREIKFRAWNKKAQDMGDWNFLRDMPVHLSWLHWGFKGDNNIILMQYIGLKDMHGTEIYEGDIMENFLDNSKGPVEFDLGGFFIKATGDELTDPSFLDIDNHGQNGYISVIGNIYENPELLDTSQ